MSRWIWFALAAAVLYGLHQVFTKLAAGRISDGWGGLVVEGTAALTIATYLIVLRVSGTWNQSFSSAGAWYSVLTGVCVGLGTIAFFVLFQRGGPLSAVPVILAVGGALMAVVGMLWFKEPVTARRLFGVMLGLAGLYLVK